jgi:hypothetical protein
MPTRQELYGGGYTRGGYTSPLYTTPTATNPRGSTPTIPTVRDRRSVRPPTEDNPWDFADIWAQIQKAYDPLSISNIFNIATGNLARKAGQDVSTVGRASGAAAGSMGFANPNAFILGNISKAQQPFFEGYGKLAEGEAQAQQIGAENLAQGMFNINRAQTTDTNTANNLALMYSQLAEQKRQFDAQLAAAIEASQPKWYDYVAGLVGAGAKSGIAPYLAFPSLLGKKSEE